MDNKDILNKYFESVGLEYDADDMAEEDIKEDLYIIDIAMREMFKEELEWMEQQIISKHPIDFYNRSQWIKKQITLLDSKESSK